MSIVGSLIDWCTNIAVKKNFQLEECNCCILKTQEISECQKHYVELILTLPATIHNFREILCSILSKANHHCMLQVISCLKKFLARNKCFDWAPNANNFYYNIFSCIYLCWVICIKNILIDKQVGIIATIMEGPQLYHTSFRAWSL